MTISPPRHCPNPACERRMHAVSLGGRGVIGYICPHCKRTDIDWTRVHEVLTLVRESARRQLQRRLAQRFACETPNTTTAEPPGSP